MLAMIFSGLRVHMPGFPKRSPTMGGHVWKCQRFISRAAVKGATSQLMGGQRFSDE